MSTMVSIVYIEICRTGIFDKLLVLIIVNNNWTAVGDVSFHLHHHSSIYPDGRWGARKDSSAKTILYRILLLLLIESLHYSRPMLGAGSSLGVELFQVFMGTALRKDGADQ